MFDYVSYLGLVSICYIYGLVMLHYEFAIKVTSTVIILLTSFIVYEFNLTTSGLIVAAHVITINSCLIILLLSATHMHVIKQLKIELLWSYIVLSSTITVLLPLLVAAVKLGAIYN